MAEKRPEEGRALADLLRDYRVRARLTQEQLAVRTQLSVRAIRDIERGRTRRPRGDSIDRLAESIGLTGEELPQLEVAVRKPSHEVPAPPEFDRLAAPCQLPAGIAHFTGRGSTIAQLRRVFLEISPDRPTATVVITGMTGVGKTTLAVHLAHILQEDFPDGQLYVDLRATKRQPLRPSQALGSFLRALGVDRGALPVKLEERAALFRSLVADRRLMVVLDDAAAEEQIRPLLPGGGGCGVMVTSRRQLVGLEGALLVGLGVLEPVEGVDLLSRIIGEPRAREELTAAHEIVANCGYLPLAIRIVGARLVARSHWKLRHVGTRLGNERRRLDELSAGDLDIRDALSRSYQTLKERERRAFRRLGLLDASDVPIWVVAALLDTTYPEAECVMDRLIEAHLLEIGATAEPPCRLRYHLHDVLRAYARERAAAEDPPQQRSAALERTLCAARRAGDRGGEAWMLRLLGDLPVSPAGHPADHSDE
jgi:transcriptional regulator with XRE-family HTH domain